MLYSYKALTKSGEERTGTIDATNEDVAISSLQRRGLIVVSVKSTEEEGIFEKDLDIFTWVTSKDLVMLSRQIAALFGAQVPALQVFRILSEQYEKKPLRDALNGVAGDIESGVPISEALDKYPSVFSDFYVHMVRTGEQTGRLNETFQHLADHLERSHELKTKVRGALVYPAFVVVTFITVMVLMFTMVIPQLTSVLVESGAEIPVYTKIVMGISDFLVEYGFFLLTLLIIGGVLVWYYNRQGMISLSKYKLSLPVIGTLFQQIFLARMASNLHTMLSSGVPIVEAIESTSQVVNDDEFSHIMAEVAEQVKQGTPLSEALSHYELVPHVMIQMTKIGEENGELAGILQRMAEFYRREVYATIDNLVSLIEPVMIVLLGIGVGFVLVAVLLPIYNLAGAF